MSHTSTHNYIHIVFGTRERGRTIPKELLSKLWAYVAGICKNKAMVAFEVGGMQDHLHILLRLPPTLSLAQAVSALKANSSRWINEHQDGFAWQAGYGAFSVSASNLRAVQKYVRQQDIHHRKMTFADEYRAFLVKHGMSPEDVPPLRGS